MGGEKREGGREKRRAESKEKRNQGEEGIKETRERGSRGAALHLNNRAVVEPHPVTATCGPKS